VREAYPMLSTAAVSLIDLFADDCPQLSLCLFRGAARCRSGRLAGALWHLGLRALCGGSRLAARLGNIQLRRRHRYRRPSPIRLLAAAEPDLRKSIRR